MQYEYINIFTFTSYIYKGRSFVSHGRDAAFGIDFQSRFREFSRL